MFIVGLKRLERERGSGWLDCPNCHEHALQDVIDAMRFASVGFFRLSPVERTRYLICRRCGFRREASDAELTALETMGRPLRRAWFVPFGALSLVLVLAVGYFAFGPSSASSSIGGITFAAINTGQLVGAQMDVPQDWNISYFTKADDQPPPRVEITTTSTGTEKIVFAKFTDAASLADLVSAHYTDQSSIQASGFPSEPPKASCVKVGDAPAALVKMTFTNAGSNAEITMYAFIHGGAGYTLTFVAIGGDTVSTMEKVAAKTAGSLKFVAGPAASASPSASPSPSPSPSATATAAPGTSPTPAYTVSCS